MATIATFPLALNPLFGVGVGVVGASRLIAIDLSRRRRAARAVARPLVAGNPPGRVGAMFAMQTTPVAVVVRDRRGLETVDGIPAGATIGFASLRRADPRPARDRRREAQRQLGEIAAPMRAGLLDADADALAADALAAGVAPVRHRL